MLNVKNVEQDTSTKHGRKLKTTNVNGQNPKIAVVGAGGIGSIVGGLLAKAGENVTLIGRKNHIDEINRHGLTISGVMGETKIDVAAQESLDFEPDVVILSVKTQDVKSTLEEIKPKLSKSVLITMQNGVRSDEIASTIVGMENIYSCVILFGATFFEPGRVVLTHYISDDAPLIMGRAFGKNNQKTDELVNILNKALPTTKTNNISGAHWTKLLLNQINAISAVTGLSMQEVSGNKKLAKLQLLLMQEALRVIDKSGIKLASLPGTPIFILKLLLKLPSSLSSLFFTIQSEVLGDITVPGSTLQSIMRSKTTEIDYLNGEIVSLGEKLNIKTPFNSSIVTLVHRTAETKIFLSVDELIEIIL